MGKIRKLPFALKLCSPYTCFLDSKYTYFTPCIPFLIASREIRDRTSGQGWASNRDSGNYPHHRYISDSPEQERVLIQVITTHICIYLVNTYMIITLLNKLELHTYAFLNMNASSRWRIAYWSMFSYAYI